MDIAGQVFVRNGFRSVGGRCKARCPNLSCFSTLYTWISTIAGTTFGPQTSPPVRGSPLYDAHGLTCWRKLSSLHPRPSSASSPLPNPHGHTPKHLSLSILLAPIPHPRSTLPPVELLTRKTASGAHHPRRREMERSSSLALPTATPPANPPPRPPRRDDTLDEKLAFFASQIDNDDPQQVGTTCKLP